MRKANFAALIIGGVSTCLFGGMLSIYATAPVVGSVAPKKDVESIYEVKNEEMANIAAVTSISTTAVTTTSRRINTTTTNTTATQEFVETTTVATTTETAAQNESISFSVSVNAATAAAAYVQPTTETPTEAYTDYNYVEPATEAPTETYIEPVTEPQTEEYTEPTYTEPETDEPSEEYTDDAPAGPAIQISDSDFIILCNAVANEAGCYWISEYDKAKVVEVIMNRVNSPFYPSTILGVLTQPWQFSGSETYVYLDTYSCYVNDSVINAVNLYLNDPSAFDHGYIGFYGDGYNNYFY